MSELRVLTVPLQPGTELFDDDALRGYLAQRELLRWEAHFFVHDGRPAWSVVVETHRQAPELTRHAPASPAAPAPIRGSAGNTSSFTVTRSRRPLAAGRRRFGRKLRGSLRRAEQGGLADERELARAASLRGHLMAADTRALRRGVIARLDGHGAPV